MEPGGSNTVTVVHTNPCYREDSSEDDRQRTGSDSSVHVVYNAFSSRCSEDEEDAKSDNDSGIDDSHEVKGKTNRNNVRRLGSSRTRKETNTGNNVGAGNVTRSDNVIHENDVFAVSIYICDNNIVSSDDKADTDANDTASDDRDAKNSRPGDYAKHVITRARAVCDITKGDSNDKDEAPRRDYVPIRNSVIFDSEDEDSEAAPTEAEEEDEGFVRFNFDDYPETVFTEKGEEGEERRRRRKSSQCILHPADIYQPHGFSSAVFTHNIYTNIKSVS
jgi:hypothetical protein